jgi:hypothetical protein
LRALSIGSEEGTQQKSFYVADVKIELFKYDKLKEIKSRIRPSLADASGSLASWHANNRGVRLIGPKFAPSNRAIRHWEKRRELSPERESVCTS